MSPENDNLSNKRIAKNTFLLYLRQVLVMLVSLYTSRVVLSVLGAIDFGIYNVVGGIVVLFSFIYGLMTNATQRFLNYEMGRQRYDNVHRVFCMGVNVHFILSLVMLLLCETIGLWFFKTRLNIPDERLNAAFWVFQVSIVNTFVNVNRVPYNASIIAYERMNFYAYLSIFEVILRLLLILILDVMPFDKLVIYSLLILGLNILCFIVYRIYCRRKLPVTHFEFMWDKHLFHKLFSYSGWSLLGGVANLSASQGLSFLLNIFTGVLTNAALGIANQVSSALNTFVINFQTAFTPQLVKSYAAGDKNFFFSLIFRSSRFSYYLLLILGVPCIVFCEDILNLWLVEVPHYATEFTRLLIIFCMIDAMSGPLWYSVQATGNIRTYQIIMSICIISNLPLSYAVLKLGLSPVYCFVVRVLINLLTHIVRIFYLKRIMDFPSLVYLRDVMIPICLVTMGSVILPIALYMPGLPLWRLCGSIIISMIVTIVIIWFVGMKKEERIMIMVTLKNKLSNHVH
ncbi:MAG: lipopolysaccharide biosynthesis protein [Paludibacteraceae bacterium]